MVCMHKASVLNLWVHCRSLEALPLAARGPLYGVPFGVKDNIDVAGFPTTAACEAYRYHPSQSAPGVEGLLEAGAHLVTDPLCSPFIDARAQIPTYSLHLVVCTRPRNVTGAANWGYLPLCVSHVMLCLLS